MGENLAAAAIITFVIGTLKKSSWFPWLSAETANINRLVSVVLSGVAAVGIHATFDRQTHSLLITGLSLSTIAVGGYHWLVQFVYTHGWFKATSASDQVLQLLKQALANQVQTSASLPTDIRRIQQ